jgi:PAS domain S-box-containing protein
MSARIIAIEGEPHILSVTRDVDDWKKAEEALLEREKSYRELFDNSADLIYTHDLEGNYTSVNKAVERLLGYTPEEFLNVNFRQILDPDYLKITEENFRMKVDGHTDRTGPYEVLVRTKGGESLWLEVNSRIVIREGQRIFLPPYQMTLIHAVHHSCLLQRRFHNLLTHQELSS